MLVGQPIDLSDLVAELKRSGADEKCAPAPPLRQPPPSSSSCARRDAYAAIMSRVGQALQQLEQEMDGRESQVGDAEKVK